MLMHVATIETAVKSKRLLLTPLGVNTCHVKICTQRMCCHITKTSVNDGEKQRHGEAEMKIEK